MTKTFGERIVRKSPSERADVKEVKRLVADLLDLCEGFVPDFDDDDPIKIEEARLIGIAATCFEEGCMWLVKGLTVPKE